MAIHKQKRLKKYGFTMVELIIVITILAILAVIAFVSFEHYARDSRDASRVSTLKSIERGIALFAAKADVYPDPDKQISIENAWNVLLYQGIVGESLSQKVRLNKLALDPKDGWEYLYGVNPTRTKYQLGTYLESEDLLSYFPTTYAANDYTNRYLYTLGGRVCLVLHADKTRPMAWVDFSTDPSEYEAHCSNNAETGKISGSGSELAWEILKNQALDENQSCVDGTVSEFFSVGNVIAPWSCPAWVSFSCENKTWTHPSLNKWDYPYASCSVVDKNNCTLSDGGEGLTLSESDPSCYFID